MFRARRLARLQHLAPAVRRVVSCGSKLSASATARLVSSILLFVAGTMTDKHNIIGRACLLRGLVNKDALAAVIHASTVSGKDNIRKPLKLGRTANGNIRRLSGGFSSLIGNRHSSSHRFALSLIGVLEA